MKVGLFFAMIKTAILIDDDYYRRKLLVPLVTRIRLLPWIP